MEEWRDVPGFDRYQVSNRGNVRSVYVKGKTRVKMIKQQSWEKYKKTVLVKDGKRYFFQTHRLEWEAFYGPIPDGMEIDHIDGDPSNNLLENLRVVDHKTNVNNPITKKRKKMLTDCEKKKRNRECSLRYYYKHRENLLQRHKEWYQKHKSAKNQDV